MALNELIAKRGQIKGGLTRFNMFLNKHGDVKIRELKARLNNLEARFMNFPTYSPTLNCC